jgi:hypothetical protein
MSALHEERTYVHLQSLSPIAHHLLVHASGDMSRARLTWLTHHFTIMCDTTMCCDGLGVAALPQFALLHLRIETARFVEHGDVGLATCHKWNAWLVLFALDFDYIGFDSSLRKHHDNIWLSFLTKPLWLTWDRLHSYTASKLAVTEIFSMFRSIREKSHTIIFGTTPGIPVPWRSFYRSTALSGAWSTWSCPSALIWPYVPEDVGSVVGLVSIITQYAYKLPPKWSNNSLGLFSGFGPNRPCMVVCL